MSFTQPYKLYALWMNHEMDSDFKIFEIRKPDRISIEERVSSCRITTFWVHRPKTSEVMNYHSIIFMLVREHSDTLDKLDDILPIDFCMKKSWPRPNSSFYYSNDQQEYSMEFEVIYPQPDEYFKFAQILDGYVKKYSKLVPQFILPPDASITVIDGENIKDKYKWCASGEQFQDPKDWTSSMTDIFSYHPTVVNPYAGSINPYVGPMPRIEAIYYNDPYTTVKWNDGSVNTVKCAEGEKFSKELGLSVIIAKKYLEVSGCIYPRAGLKRLAESGIDQTAKTKARKEYKAKKKSKK